MWPGYQASTNGRFQNVPGMEALEAASIEDADANVVDKFPGHGNQKKRHQALMATRDLPLVVYSNGHWSEGMLPGINQLISFNTSLACPSTAPAIPIMSGRRWPSTGSLGTARRRCSITSRPA